MLIGPLVADVEETESLIVLQVILWRDVTSRSRVWQRAWRFKNDNVLMFQTIRQIIDACQGTIMVNAKIQEF